MSKITMRLVRIWALIAVAGASVYFAGSSAADVGGWQPCRQASPLVPCSMDSQYPCGPNTPIWRCPPLIDDATLEQKGLDFLGGQPGRYMREDLGFIGGLATNNRPLLNSYGANALTSAGRGACQELDAAQGRDDALNMEIAAQLAGANHWQHGEGGLIVGTAMHWYCPKWRPMLYGYHVRPDGSVDGAP